MEVIYKAFNGKEFKSKEECEDYEKESDENHNLLYFEQKLAEYSKARQGDSLKLKEVAKDFYDCGIQKGMWMASYGNSQANRIWIVKEKSGKINKQAFLTKRQAEEFSKTKEGSIIIKLIL